jgi:cysteine synthase A
MELADHISAAAQSQADRDWVCEAVDRIGADYNRSSDTHLIRLRLAGCDGISLYLKDESTHPSGSLKHRLARSLFLYGLCNGWIVKDTTIVEASSGSTAISEAYFARLLGLPFIAVVPKTTAHEKIEQIEFHGGECHKVDPQAIYQEAEKLAARLGGHYMDQFTYAERATDWRGSNNIAESLFAQMAREPHPVPDWVVMSAGTGGTSATIGRYIRYRPELFGKTRLCVADPENSVFFDYFQSRDAGLRSARGSRIEGIGRPRVEPSFQPDVIDRMMCVPDAASIATIWWLERRLGRKCGGSTGTNVFGALKIIAEMKERGLRGSVVTMICDSGERYLDSYYNADWVAAQGLDPERFGEWLETFTAVG